MVHITTITPEPTARGFVNNYEPYSTYAIKEEPSNFAHTWRLAKTDADGGDSKDLTIM